MERIHPNVEFTHQTELKFFKLIKCLADKEDSIKKQLVDKTKPKGTEVLD